MNIFFFLIAEKGGSLSKGSTAWTFGLFSGDTPPTASSLSSSHHRHRQTGFVTSGKNRASSVAPSPELIHRSFTPTQATTACIPQATLLPSFLVRNERRTRSLERCSHQRVQQRNSPANTSSSFNTTSNTAAYVTKPPTTSSSVRSRSLERTYQISTTRIGSSIADAHLGQGKTSSSLNQQAANSGTPPQLPSRRNQVPPEVLATWCTFNEAFGGSGKSSSNNTGRSRPQPPLPPPPCEPFAVLSDERDSPGSPVFEELFLPPPQRFSESSGVISNKRNSFAGSGSCSCSCSGGGGGRGTPCCGHSAGCSSRSSPVPPTGCSSSHSGQPETVLYGTREAPVLERHCVEGGEFIIAWLSHSGSPSSSSGAGSSSGGGGNVNNNNSNNSKSSTPPYPRTVPLLTADMHSSGTSGGTATNTSGGTTNGAGSNRSFINKPARGWLHSDAVIVREGITYFVRVSAPYVSFFLFHLKKKRK